MSETKSEFQEIQETGSRLVGAFSDLGHIGPKHHALVIGRNIIDDEIYVAENRAGTNLQLSTISDFKKRYINFGDIKLLPNEGNKYNRELAVDALNDVSTSTEKYNLISNNCESFVNKLMHGKKSSNQVVTAIGLIFVAGLSYYFYKESKKDKVV